MTRRCCTLCGCTDRHACAGGCWWVGPVLCSMCAFSPVGIAGRMKSIAFVIICEGRYFRGFSARGAVLTRFRLAEAALFVPGQGRKLCGTFARIGSARPSAPVSIEIIKGPPV